jgi:hypothetical protein
MSQAIQPESLTKSAFETYYTGLYWQAYLPYGQAIPSNLVTSYICNWTDITQSLYTNDEALKFALLANCLCNVAGSGDKPWMEAEGQRMYGQALRNLKTSLMKPKNDAAIIAAKLLSNFEVILSLYHLHISVR